MLSRIGKQLFIFHLHDEILVDHFFFVEAILKVVQANLKNHVVYFLRIGDFGCLIDGLFKPEPFLFPYLSSRLQLLFIEISAVGVRDNDYSLSSVLFFSRCGFR